MKKIIIIAAVILSSAVTAFCITSKQDNAASGKIKIEKADFAAKSTALSSGLATAD